VSKHVSNNQLPVSDLGAAATPGADFERELRRLRFKDRVLERAFLDDYARRRLPQFKLWFWLGMLVQIPAALRFRFVLHIGPTGWWQIILSRWLGITTAALGLLLARYDKTVRWVRVYNFVYVLFLGYYLVNTTTRVPIGWTTLCTFLVAACITSRLRAVEAVLVQFILIGLFAYATVNWFHRPTGFLVTPLLSLATLAVFITGANYMIESSARRDFILMRLLGQEREKSERLLLNVLPPAIAERLKQSPGTIADSFDEITVLFADIADSTPQIAKLEPEQAVELLNEIFTAFDRLAHKHGLEKIKTIGDAYMVVGGLPEPRDDHAQAVVAMAVDMQKEVAKFRWPTGEPLVLRVGINTGPAVAGVIGTSKFIYDLWGDTVNVASRMESHGVAGGIQLTETTYKRVRRRHRCTQRVVNVKGKGPMPVYLLASNGTKRRVRRKELARR
jgi:class 3 adenylate cyclase